MCRIVGIFDFNNTLGVDKENLIISMRDKMAHGGPDDAGLFISENKNIYLGHRRLSIIDLSKAGHQPMENDSRNIWITFNGEIYNYLEIKKDLINVGYSFRSNSDTEVLLKGYEHWGIDILLNKLRGMFAFCIFDNRNGIEKLVLARDRFGIKPLYYYKDNEKFIFASEVKAFRENRYIKNERSHDALISFLLLGSIPSPLTSIKNVFSLPKAHYLEIEKDKFIIKEYWDINNYFNKSINISRNEAIERTSNLLNNSIDLHLVSDVPVGIFLSGGIDSSALVALAKKSKKTTNELMTLSIVFEEEEFSEVTYSRLIASKYNTNHNEILLKKNIFSNEISDIFSAMDEPTTDGVNSYFISKAANEAGLKVILSGIGGDELFLGYNYYKNTDFINYILNILRTYPNSFRNDLISNLIKLKIFSSKSLEKLSYLSDPSNINTYLMFRGNLSKETTCNLLSIGSSEINNLNLFPGFNEDNLPRDINILDYNHYLQNQILKDVDSMSMSQSLEIRVQFLENDLFDYVSNLSSTLKISTGMNKPLLVRSLGDDFPKEIWNRKKMGFTFPFKDWIKNDYKTFKDISLDNNFLNKVSVENMWNEFLEDRIHWSKIWTLVVASKKFGF